MKSVLKNLVIFAGLAALLYAGYNFFFSGGDIYLDNGTGSSQGEVLTREFLVRLNELERIDFSRELFDDVRFRSLTSFDSLPTSATAGRSNPFAP